MTNAVTGNFWAHESGVSEIARATNLGSTGWDDETDYAFNIIFTSMLIEVSVNGVTELSITPSDVAGISSFSDGAFGFYNYSQSNVLYSAITQTDCELNPTAPECQTGGNIPVPTPLMLLAAAIMGFGINRRLSAK